MEQSEKLRALDAKHHLHPFTDSRQLHAKGVNIITEADGVYLQDSAGNRIIDAMAGLWCVNVGYGRQELVDAAAAQMARVPYYNTFFGSTTESTTRLAEKISSITPPGLDHVFFTNSGSEANDTVIKAVRFYWNLKGKRNKKLIISREFSYHGVTMATASLSGLSDMHPQSDLPLPGICSRIEAPYYYRFGGNLTPQEYGLKAARALEEKILELGADNVGAFIGEPVYGAGGVMVPPENYWPEINRICKKYDLLLIADEVVCGFGRTGSWFGSDTFGIQPDLMAVAKGLSSGYLPIAGVVFHQRIAEELIQHGGEWVHGFTYSGHPTACAVALKNIEIIERENLVLRVQRDIGPYFQQRIGSLIDHPLVGEVRGVGLLGAIELVKNKKTKERFNPEGEVARTCRDLCRDNGLVVRAVRDCLVMSPPLIIEKHTVDQTVEIIKRCLNQSMQLFGIDKRAQEAITD